MENGFLMGIQNEKKLQQYRRVFKILNKMESCESKNSSLFSSIHVVFFFYKWLLFALGNGKLLLHKKRNLKN